MAIRHSQNISATNNCVVNCKKKTDEYYIFDQTNLYLKNLSSLIDPPPLAFNTSFLLLMIINNFSVHNH